MTKKFFLGIIIIIAVVIFGIVMLKKNNIAMVSESVTSAPVETTNTTAPTGTTVPVKTTTGSTMDTTTISTTDTTTDPKTFSLVQVATHNTEADCYSAINGQVYDLTAWIKKHPGGDRAILSICGKDGSSAFNGEHGGESKPEKILAGFEVGNLIK